MAPKAMKMKTAMKAMKKNSTPKQLAERKKARDGERNKERDQSGLYSRVDERKKLEEAEEENRKLKEELRLKEEELGRLKEMEKGKKTWGRMGGGDGVVDFRREAVEGQDGRGGWMAMGYQAGYGAAEAIDGGAKWGMYDRKEVWVEGFQDGWDEFLAEKRRKEKEEEKRKRKVKEEEESD